MSSSRGEVTSLPTEMGVGNLASHFRDPRLTPPGLLTHDGLRRPADSGPTCVPRFETRNVFSVRAIYSVRRGGSSLHEPEDPANERTGTTSPFIAGCHALRATGRSPCTTHPCADPCATETDAPSKIAGFSGGLLREKMGIPGALPRVGALCVSHASRAGPIEIASGRGRRSHRYLGGGRRRWSSTVAQPAAPR
jgi:hypothetical protein